MGGEKINTVDGEARESPKGTDRTARVFILPLVANSGGEVADGSDEIKIKRSGLKSPDVRIWGDDPHNQGHPHAVRC